MHDCLAGAVLNRASGGVVFTTIRKFAPAGRGGFQTYPYSDRRNVIVIAGEAHRSQYGFRAIALRPDWHSPDDNEGTIKIVMTGSATDPPDWQPHIGNKARRDQLAKRLKDPEDPLKLVIVRDMWLTGFDAPSMHSTPCMWINP